MKKYEVHWVSNNQNKFHGVFDTLEEAQNSVRDWWSKNNYTPPYIRAIIKEDCIVWDYGLHNAFYVFKKVENLH